MAAIDKIYGTEAQYDEFLAWCEKNNEELLQYFYEWAGWPPDGLQHPITNLPEWADMWLLAHCPIGWVIDRIQDQYGIGGFGETH